MIPKQWLGEFKKYVNYIVIVRFLFSYSDAKILQVEGVSRVFLQKEHKFIVFLISYTTLVLGQWPNVQSPGSILIQPF